MDFDDPHARARLQRHARLRAEQARADHAGFELAERLDPAEVTVTSLHPSTYMPTKMVLEERGASVDSLEDGVAATVRLAVDPELEGVTGRFYDRQRGDRSPTRRRRPRGAPPPLGALARAHRRARAGALDRDRRREQPEEALEQRASPTRRSTSSSGRPCQSTRRERGRDRPITSRRGRRRLAAPTVERDRLATRARNRSSPSRSSTVASTHPPRPGRTASSARSRRRRRRGRRSPPGNGARLPQRPSPMHQRLELLAPLGQLVDARAARRRRACARRTHARGLSSSRRRWESTSGAHAAAALPAGR